MSKLKYLYLSESELCLWSSPAVFKNNR